MDLELEKQCRLHGLALNQNLIQTLNVDSCNHCDSSLGHRPDSLLLSPPQRFNGRLLNFGRAKRSELREREAIILDTLIVYIDPGIRYLVLTKLGTIVDIMIYNQF